MHRRASVVDDRFVAAGRDDIAGAACTRRASVVDDRFVAAGRDDIAGAACTHRTSVVDDRFVAAGRDDIAGAARTRRAGIVDDRHGAAGRDDVAGAARTSRRSRGHTCTAGHRCDGHGEDGRRLAQSLRLHFRAFDRALELVRVEDEREFLSIRRLERPLEVGSFQDHADRFRCPAYADDVERQLHRPVDVAQRLLRRGAADQ